MNNHKILFDNLEWTEAGVGVRYKAFVNGNQRLRLVEFSEGFIEPDWCTHGHAGIVLDGSFALDFNGNIEQYNNGDLIFIPNGEADKHKAILGKGEKVTLLLFELLQDLSEKKYNPWHDFPHKIYEKHMGHENVKQLEMLSRITGEQLSLVADIHSPVVALLGVTDGNGLSNVKKGQFQRIIGVDINEEFLNLCRQKYSYLSELGLYKIDLMTEKEKAVDILQNADLVTANLLVKHIHLDNFIDIVSKLTKSIVSVTIQFNPDGQAVSTSGFEKAFDEIQQHGQDCTETELATAMCDAGYKFTGRTEYTLPNGKIFIRLDYKRQEENV